MRHLTLMTPPCKDLLPLTVNLISIIQHLQIISLIYIELTPFNVDKQAELTWRGECGRPRQCAGGWESGIFHYTDGSDGVVRVVVGEENGHLRKEAVILQEGQHSSHTRHGHLPK